MNPARISPRLYHVERLAQSAIADAPLPPVGANPVGDLQHRLCDAALREFFAEPTARTAFAYSPLRRIGAVLVAGIGAWAAVFGAGSMLLH